MTLKDGSVRLAATRGAKLGALDGFVCWASFARDGGIERGHLATGGDARRETDDGERADADGAQDGGESADGGKRGRFRGNIEG